MAPCGLTEAVFRGHDLPLEPVLLLQEPPRCPQAPCRVPTGSQKAPQRKCLELKPWIDKYRLGELWMRGEIGGTRW